MKTPEILKVKNLRLGDVVKLAGIYLNDNSPNNEMTVTQITETEVNFFRVYVSLGNFTHTGGVTPYIGTENVRVSIESPLEYSLLGNIYYGK